MAENKSQKYRSGPAKNLGQGQQKSSKIKIIDFVPMQNLKIMVTLFEVIPSSINYKNLNWANKIRRGCTKSDGEK